MLIDSRQFRSAVRNAQRDMFRERTRGAGRACRPLHLEDLSSIEDRSDVMACYERQVRIARSRQLLEGFILEWTHEAERRELLRRVFIHGDRTSVTGPELGYTKENARCIVSRFRSRYLKLGS